MQSEDILCILQQTHLIKKGEPLFKKRYHENLCFNYSGSIRNYCSWPRPTLPPG